jgi:hypothetical protein
MFQALDAAVGCSWLILLPTSAHATQNLVDLVELSPNPEI